MKSLVGLVILAGELMTISLALADEPIQLPAPDPFVYRNIEYEFSVKLPSGYPACVDVYTNHGVGILLKPAERCETQYDIKAYDRNRHINVWAAYNAAEVAHTSKGIARWHCLDGQTGKITWLRDKKLGGRPAGGCRRDNADGTISVTIVTLRKTLPNAPWDWIEVGAELTTTPETFEVDDQVFETVIKGVSIHPDGPHL
jgi:hypothetical protein